MVPVALLFDFLYFPISTLNVGLVDNCFRSLPCGRCCPSVVMLCCFVSFDTCFCVHVLSILTTVFVLIVSIY